MREFDGHTWQACNKLVELSFKLRVVGGVVAPLANAIACDCVNVNGGLIVSDRTNCVFQFIDVFHRWFVRNAFSFVLPFDDDPNIEFFARIVGAFISGLENSETALVAPVIHAPVRAFFGS